MSRTKGRIRLLAVALAVGGSLGLVASSSAEPVTGGKTVLKPDVDTFEALADMSIGVDTTGAASFGNRGAKFPISGGIVGEAGKDTIEHKGGIAFFREGGAGVKVSKLTVVLGKNKGKVFGKSDGAELAFLKLDLSESEGSGVPGSITIKGAAASLTRQSAAVLSEAFDEDIRKGVPMGELKIKASVG
jgi:hypothetical protein